MQSYGSNHGSRYGGSFSQPTLPLSSDFDELMMSSQAGPSSQHEASQSSQRPQCPECGTRKMRLRAGQLICKRGHVQQHFRIEQAEDDEFLGDGVARKRRAVNVNKIRRLKSQHTPHYSLPDTDVEPEDSEEEQLEQETRRAHKRARRQSSRSRSRSRSRYSARPDDVGSSGIDSYDDDDDDDDPPYSIRADSFFERDPRSSRSYAASSAAEESGLDSEPDTFARASRRGIRRIWRSGVGLHGAYEGRFALLQCLQLVLRLQLHKLRELWGDKLPPETEAIARDLWTMFISLLPAGHYPPEPLIAATFDWHTRYSLSQERAAELFPNHATYDPETDIRQHRRRTLFNGYHHHLERKQRSTDGQQRSEERSEPEAQDLADSDDPAAAKDCIDWIVGQDGERDQSRSRRTSEQEALVDPEDELAELDPVFAEERRQRRRSQAASELESDSQDQQSVLDPPAGQGNRQKRRRHIPAWATKHSVAKAQAEILHLAIMPTTISIIYLSLHLLKIPIFWVDLVRHISSYKLPYLNVVHSLPLPLTQSLNKDNVHHHHLDTDVVPSITTLHLHTLSVADLLHRTYEIDFGEGNTPGQLARIVEGMLLPPTFYVATKRVMEMISRGVGPGLLPGPPQKERCSTQHDSGAKEGTPAALLGAAQLQRVPKEFVIMAALLVVIKMRYGLDGRERVETLIQPSDEKKGGAAGISCAPSLEPWLGALDKRRQRYLDSQDAVTELDPAELDALHMTADQIEAYAAFAGEHLILSNQIDLHEWRRLEPQRRWASFIDLMPSASSSLQNPPGYHSSSGAATDLAAQWAELESDLRSIYRKHTAEPFPRPTTALEAGSAYPMHQFTTTIRTDADPLGLTHSPLYPRVIHHANHVVGIPTPATASNAMDAMINQLVNPRAEKADATVKGWESGFGIQAHLEAVERMVEAVMRERARRVRRCLGEVHREKVGEGRDDGDDDQGGSKEHTPDTLGSETEEEVGI